MQDAMKTLLLLSRVELCLRQQDLVLKVALNIASRELNVEVLEIMLQQVPVLRIVGLDQKFQVRQMIFKLPLAV